MNNRVRIIGTNGGCLSIAGKLDSSDCASAIPSVLFDTIQDRQDGKLRVSCHSTLWHPTHRISSNRVMMLIHNIQLLHCQQRCCNLGLEQMLLMINVSFFFKVFNPTQVGLDNPRVITDSNLWITSKMGSVSSMVILLHLHEHSCVLIAVDFDIRILGPNNRHPCIWHHLLCAEDELLFIDRSIENQARQTGQFPWP